ncbi:MAG TPA: HAMP domain-containing sensor histidine kinase [Acidimicrobiales bacterium]|nr:HAMP domain-containing sensor histidine kinase [Acidimicrobiales bacterium]
MRRRLILANLALVAAVLFVLEVPFAVVYSRHEHDALDAALQRDGAALAVLAGEIVEHPGDHDVAGLAQRFSGEPGELVTMVDAHGVDLTGGNVLSRDPGFRAVLDAARRGSARTGELNGIVYVAAPVAGGGAVLVARTDESIDHRVHQFWFVLCGLGVLVLGLSLIISSRLSRWVVDPLVRLDRQAAALGRGELSARADTAHGPPEVMTLAATFNEMADRLDELVTSQRRFVADASHQLRTPLTAMQLRLETLDPHNEAAREAALDEVARLTRLVDGLLSLARAEGRRSVREPVSISSAVAERHDAWLPLATEQRVALELDVDGPSALTAELVPGHLEQILDNLIDNALDVSPPESTVTLRAVRVGSGIEVHVIDEGPGMSDEERVNAFAPFWQGAAGPRTGRSGLGLAIAQQLTRASHGSLRLDRSPRGGIDAVLRLRCAAGRGNGRS